MCGPAHLITQMYNRNAIPRGTQIDKAHLFLPHTSPPSGSCRPGNIVRWDVEIGRGHTTARPEVHDSKCESRGGASPVSRGNQDLVGSLDHLDRSAFIVPVSRLFASFSGRQPPLSSSPPRRMNLPKPKAPTDLEKNGVRTGITLWVPVPALGR